MSQNAVVCKDGRRHVKLRLKNQAGIAEMTQQTFDVLLFSWIALAILLIPFQLVITAPYGKHHSERWGALMDYRLGWIAMEIVSPIAFGLSLLWGGVPASKAVWFFFILWAAHYLNRSLVYPFRTRTAGKKIPIAIVGTGIAFNMFTGWSNGFYLNSSWATYPDDWFQDPRFVVGLMVFLTGAAINLWADNRLLGLRKPPQVGYAIPRGGLFDRISCPNYFGEIIEWTGFAILCWNLPAAAFAVWTAANLVPRALSHHSWYATRFPDYPAQRKAVIPFLL